MENKNQQSYFNDFTNSQYDSENSAYQSPRNGPTIGSYIKAEEKRKRRKTITFIVLGAVFAIAVIIEIIQMLT